MANQGLSTMLWVFLSAGLTGLLCAGLFGGPAIIILSMMSFGGILLALSLDGHALGSAFITAFLTSGALQLGFLLGICLQHFWRQIVARVLGLSEELNYRNLLHTTPLHKPRLRAGDQRDKIRNLAG
jgi:hypothetical protein